MSEDLLKQFLTVERLETLSKVASARTSQLTLLLDDVHKEHNIAAVIRSADAFGLRAVHTLGDYAHNPNISMGAERWVDVISHTSPEAALSHLQGEGFEFVILEPVGADADRPSIPVFNLPFEKKLALIFGNELSGISEPLRQAAHYRAFIPMLGFVESFNISVAVAITLFCSTVDITGSQRKVPPVSESEREEIMRKWLRQDVRNGELILKELETRAGKQKG